MPWSVKKLDGKYCVVKEGETSGIKGGCHDAKSEAAAHVRALYASEAEAAVSEIYTEEVDMETEVEDDFEEFADGDSYEFSDTMKEYAWEGPIVFENITTGDNRVFKADSINWQEDTLPWAFRWQKASGQGHAGSVPIGRVDRLERKEDGSIHGFGVIIPELSTEATEYYKILKAGVGGGVSVDGDSAEFEIQEKEGGQPRVEFSAMRLRALSAVDIPAFNGARIHLIEDAPVVEVPLDTEAEVVQAETEATEELAKKPFPFEKKDAKATDEEDKAEGESDEEDTDEDAEDKDEKAKDEKDKGKKKFPWDKKVEADLDLREELAKKKRKKKAMGYGWQIDEALTAAAIPVLPSTDAFVDPVFDGPTPLTVTPDGKVFGHLALFNTCHIGFPGACVKPPKGSKYQYFHTGQLETAEGDVVEVGRLTFKTGHAEMQANPRVAAEHYDNTGAVAADVRAGEDKFGIWVAGALRPHLTDADIREFRCAPLSGDWRRIAGKLELVGALSVNVPGFPVPRVRAMIASGNTETLITFLEDNDEEFTVSDYELNLRLDKKIELAGKMADIFKEVPRETIPEGAIKEDVPPAPTKKNILARAENLTKNELFADLQAVRELLDSGEKMPKRVREAAEELYALFINVEGNKRNTFNGLDLDIIENSGLEIEEWEAQLELSGLDVQEFYNQCHDDSGQFCPGTDGPGRLRDNVKGRHPAKDDQGNYIPASDPRHGTRAGQSAEEHTKEEADYAAKKASGGTTSSSTSSNTSSNPSSNTSSNNNNNPQQQGGGGGVNPKLYENFITTRARARGWAALATIAALALHSPASGLISGIATAGGIGILANPAVLTLAIVTGVGWAAKNTFAARKHRVDYNRQVTKKLARDRLNQRQQRERERHEVAT